MKKKGKRSKDGWLRKIDNRSRWQGDIDLEKKVIRINKKKSKKKSTIIDTVCHEEMHKNHPQMHEKTVYKKTPKLVKKMSVKNKKKLYSKYQRR